MSALSKLRLRTFSLTYSPTYYPVFASTNVLSDPSHPLYLSNKHRHDSRARVGLWWSATASYAVGKKKVVRSWASRRLRNAFIEALAEAGLNREGIWVRGVVERDRAKEHALADGLKNGDGDGDACGADGPELFGTMKLMASPNILMAKFAEVREEAGRVVEEMVNMKTGHAPATKGKREMGRTSQRTLDGGRVDNTSGIKNSDRRKPEQTHNSTHARSVRMKTAWRNERPKDDTNTAFVLRQTVAEDPQPVEDSKTGFGLREMIVNNQRGFKFDRGSKGNANAPTVPLKTLQTDQRRFVPLEVVI